VYALYEVIACNDVKTIWSKQVRKKKTGRRLARPMRAAQP
jgi:hypothetical protein